MIIAPVTDPFLRATVRRAALPDEDVFWKPHDAVEALRCGFPRVVVAAEGDDWTSIVSAQPVHRRPPLLVVTPARLESWRSEHAARGFAVSRVDDHGRRLRSLMNAAADPVEWIADLFRDLGAAAGVPVPVALRGFGRRVLEFPSHYDDLGAVSSLAGISRGALKARFRRRDLPSPYTYLRWYRALAAVHVLTDLECTTEEAAFRVGLHSSGNFCRYVQEVSGLSPREVRGRMGRVRTLTRFVETCLHRSQIEEWKAFEDLFLEDVA